LLRRCRILETAPVAQLGYALARARRQSTLEVHTLTFEVMTRSVCASYD